MVCACTLQFLILSSCTYWMHLCLLRLRDFLRCDNLCALCGLVLLDACGRRLSHISVLGFLFACRFGAARNTVKTRNDVFLIETRLALLSAVPLSVCGTASMHHEKLVSKYCGFRSTR